MKELLDAITIDKENGKFETPNGKEYYENDEIRIIVSDPTQLVQAQPKLIQFYKHGGDYRAYTYPNRFWIESDGWIDAIKLYDMEVSKDETTASLVRTYVGHPHVDPELKTQTVFTAKLSDEGYILEDVVIESAEDFIRGVNQIEPKYKFLHTEKLSKHLIEGGYIVVEENGVTLAIRSTELLTYVAVFDYKLAAATLTTSMYEATQVFNYNRVKYTSIVALGETEVCHDPRFTTES